MYETFDHTADVGLRVKAPSLDQLFAEAGRGLLAVILGDASDVRPQLSRRFQIDGTDLAYLLVDWLNELLFAFESQHVLLAKFDVHVGRHGLVATAWGEEVDATRHPLQREVKAITYHGLFVAEERGTWTAEVILDI
jgi:SHS2 domain-containing protein